MKAITLASLKIGKKTHKASTDDEIVVVDLTQKEFDRLEAMNAVRKATDKEIKFAGVEDAEVVDETPADNPADTEAAKGGKSTAAGTKATPTQKKTGVDSSLDI